MTDKKATLLKLNENLNILKEREAKYGGNAPLDLLNQIVDHEQAITLTRQVITGEISEEEWEEALKLLLLAMNNGQVVNIKAETYVAGDVKGDIVAGDKTAGDKVLGDKIITVTYQAPPPPLPPAEAQERRDLGILLNKVKTFWIEGVLKKSIHQVALIDLGKETQAEAVAHAWEQVLELPDQSRQTLSPEKKISHIFDEMNRALLILGEPGSGKTITLLQLAQDLIAQAEADETFSHPVPAVFNLSSWLNKGQPLIDWMVAELTAKYQIPKRIGRPWLENNRLLPLLDGLDEVKPENQAACVKAINQFGAEFGLAGLVVCSRLKEYTRLPVRLKLNGAIRLQLLTLEQIYDYLGVAGSKLDALRSTLQSDDSLREMAQSPLILGIMSLAYQDVPLEKITQEELNTPEKRRKHLFDTYIERMFRRTGQREKPYTDEQTKGWLLYLAQEMTQHNLSIFQIEQLQPSWLSSHKWRWVYIIGSRLIIMLMGGLALGLLMAIGDAQILSLPDKLIPGLWGWLIVGLLLGLYFAVISSLISVILFQRHANDANGIKPPTRRQLVFDILTYGLSFGVGSVLILVPFAGSAFGLINGIVFGAVGGLLFGLKGRERSLTNDIQTIEILSWSWSRALKFFPCGLFGGLLLGLILGWILGLDKELLGNLSSSPFFGLGGDQYFILNVGLFCGLFGGLIMAMAGGISNKVIEAKTTPYQGIWLSVRNALLIGLSFGLLSTLSFSLIGGLLFGLANGLAMGTTAALVYGGSDAVQHFILSAILWYNGYIPRQYIHFLDYAVERVFLQKVGGGYIFIHRLLLEHFASMNEMNVEMN